MFGAAGALDLGTVLVHKVDHRGFTPEELAEQALNRIISVGDQSHPVIRDQAEAFRDQVRSVLVSYMKRAVESRNTTLINRFTEAGHPELIKLLEI
jgi:hypothetical protein